MAPGLGAFPTPTIQIPDADDDDHGDYADYAADRPGEDHPSGRHDDTTITSTSSGGGHAGLLDPSEALSPLSRYSSSLSPSLSPAPSPSSFLHPDSQHSARRLSPAMAPDSASANGGPAAVTPSNPFNFQTQSMSVSPVKSVRSMLRTATLAPSLCPRLGHTPIATRAPN